MDTTDVDLNTDRAQERLTTHLFDQSLGQFLGPLGSAVRMPSDMSSWPPTVLFEAIYASTVLNHFGFAPTHIKEKWGDVFYPGGPTKAAHTDDERRHDRGDANKELSERQKASRQRRYERCNGRYSRMHPLDMLMMYRFSAMEPEDVRAYLKECEEIAVARERNRLEEKVNSWRDSLPTSGAVQSSVVAGPASHRSDSHTDSVQSSPSTGVYEGVYYPRNFFLMC
jgi:hypothetical protein